MISLTPAKPADVEAIATLLAELDAYYGGPLEDPTPERVRLIHDAIFGPDPAGYVLLAWDGDRLVGFASYSFLWPAAGVSRSIFLKELYVIEAQRQRGVGRLLIAELSRIAIDHGCSRLEWAADTDNPTAQRFYAQLGVPPDTTKTFHRLAGDALAQMASSPISGRPS
jgi:GNAT superfamily N-acetyltransferase